MDYDFLASLRRNHPAWRLLAADSAPFVISFLYQCFVRPNMRALTEQDLTSRLYDYLYALRERLGDEAPPRSPREYLIDWVDNSRGWLRRYYLPTSDEPDFDLTPAAERAIHWLTGLEQRRFVGAESRLKLVFDLLHQIAEGSETDPRVRVAELERRRELIDAEIQQIRAGKLSLMEPTPLRERFLQAIDTARALLADFRQVEQNFRDLDRQVRERFMTREGGKGGVLDEVFSERDTFKLFIAKALLIHRTARCRDRKWPWPRARVPGYEVARSSRAGRTISKSFKSVAVVEHTVVNHDGSNVPRAAVRSARDWPPTNDCMGLSTRYEPAQQLLPPS